MSILTLDIGTSSCRLMLWDENGRTPLAQIPYEMQTSSDGGVFMDADTLVSYVVACFDKAVPLIPNNIIPVRAVGFSSFLHSLLGLDAHGVPVTPILNWSDTRSAEVCTALRQRLDTPAIHQRTGCILHTSYYPAKIVWLREKHAEVYDRVARWVSPSEYLMARLFGLSLNDLRASVSIASGTGLYNHHTGDWDDALLGDIGIPKNALSPICSLSETYSGLKTEYASRWDILKNTPFLPAVGDGACSNVGSDCNSPDRFAINLGTSGAIRAVTSQSDISVPFGLWQYRVDRSRALVGTAFSDGGHIMEWLHDTLCLPDWDVLIPKIDAIAPTSHGLTFLPFLSGERGMNWNPNARAAIVGLNLDTDPVEIVRAAMESVALQFAAATESLSAVFPNVQEIVASGGAFKHFPNWLQILADAIGQPVALSSEPEATSRGAAVLALEVLGDHHFHLAPASVSTVYQPDSANHALYRTALDKLRADYSKINPALS